MWIDPGILAVIFGLAIGGIAFYLGWTKGIKEGAEGMFESLEDQEYIRTVEQTDSEGNVEIVLIEPDWKKTNPRLP